MNKATGHFNTRKDEIDEYFSFLEKLELNTRNPQIKYWESNQTEKLEILPTSLIEIFKANGYLLIYNLLESSCRNAIWEILNNIHLKEIKYKDLKENIKKMWLLQKIKNLKDPQTHTQKIQDEFYNIIKSIIDDEIIEFQYLINTLDPDDAHKTKLDVFGLAGSINGTKINDLSSSFGLIEIQNKTTFGSLEEIKDKRNHLAHGRITFIESVKNKSVPDMIKYKNDSVICIQEFLNNVEQFINQI